MAAVVPPGSARMLAYAPAGDLADLVLLELDQALLAEILATGVTIKGSDPDSEARLCTQHKTYRMKYVETTNTQLLIQPTLNQTMDWMDTDDGLEDQAFSQGESATQRLASPAGLQTQRQKIRRTQRQGNALVVTATSKGHLEVMEMAPELDVLHALLAQRPYDDQEAEQSHQEAKQTRNQHQQLQGSSEAVVVLDGSTCNELGGTEAPTIQRSGTPTALTRRKDGLGLYTFDRLRELVPASDNQIMSELQAKGALLLDGCWRLVDPGYLGQLLELLILTAQSEGWSLDAVPLELLAASLAADGYQPELTAHCVSQYGRHIPASGATCSETESLMQVDGTPGPGTWMLDEDKVCMHFAQKQFAAIASATVGALVDEEQTRLLGPALSLTQFLVGWQAAVPFGMQVAVGMLRGEALVEGKGSSAMVRALRQQELSADPRERFQALFSIRQQWEATELEPFLVSLKVPGQTAAALLLKYARASQLTPEALVFYTAK